MSNEALESRMAELEERVDQLERAHAATRSDVDDVKRALRQLETQVGRLADIATTQGLTLDKVLRNTQRLVEIFEPTVVVNPEASSG